MMSADMATFELWLDGMTDRVIVENVIALLDESVVTNSSRRSLYYDCLPHVIIALDSHRWIS
jgi:hypothetical protein